MAIKNVTPSNKPFFIPTKEIELFDAMNEELIDDIIGQTVDIYKISVEDTEEICMVNLQQSIITMDLELIVLLIILNPKLYRMILEQI